jgi:hypothetical protein
MLKMARKLWSSNKGSFITKESEGKSHKKSADC